ncbi:hypothetical protein [Microbacterium sp. XT11]|uniref:AraC-like ligand-binding domain-containing protein n=1 Tax=Microbacterium sp. XT11 TaxID=367477 RepID=UPI0018DD7E70|nr:hypothetical protein [Microbacterium sp. XT11]
MNARVLTLAASRGRRTVYSLTGVEGARRLSANVEVTPADPQRFRARLLSVPLDTVAYEELSAAAFSMTSASTQELVRFIEVQGGVLHFDDPDRPPLRPGEMTAVDTGAPFRLRASEAVRLATLVVPRAALRLPAVLPGDRFLAPITSPLRAAWSSLVRSLGVSAPDDGTRDAEILAHAIIGLTRGLLTPDALPEEEPAAAVVRRARAIIERDYADPSLGPSAIARAVGVSERRLHRLFRTEDLTVAQSIASDVPRRRSIGS